MKNQLAPLACLSIFLPCVCTIAWKSILQNGQTKLHNYFEWLEYHSGFGEQCQFTEKPSASIRALLQSHIQAQDRAIDAIVAAIEAWEFSHSHVKDRTPLTLAFTGPTGTGKTEASNILAQGLFKHTRTLYKSDKRIPSGLLVLRGEDFSDAAYPITAYHNKIKEMLFEHFYRCSGKAMVVFDEVQKVVPHTLDVLMEAMSESAQLTFAYDGSTSRMDTSKVVFVFISDIGVEDMKDLIRSYPSKALVPAIKLEHTVKSALDAQWARLSFAKVINKVVPFLPLQQIDIEQIITAKLSRMDERYRGQRWERLWFEPNLAHYLSLLDSIHYEQRKRFVDNKIASIELYAKYGARNVEHGPLQQLKSKLFRYLRPWNPDAQVRLSLLTEPFQISIVSCAQETDQASFHPIRCVTKWTGTLE